MLDFLYYTPEPSWVPPSFIMDEVMHQVMIWLDGYCQKVNKYLQKSNFCLKWRSPSEDPRWQCIYPILISHQLMRSLSFAAWAGNG
jgi:hypothetical protein